MLKLGSLAPDISIQTDFGWFELTEQIGKKVVVFFFPRADTSGCTKEAIQFSALDDAFTEEKTVVIGISKDRPAKLARFRLKHNLTCLLRTDLKRICVNNLAYGSKNQCMEKILWASKDQVLLSTLIEK